MKRNIIAAAGAALLLSAVAAQAAPITTPPPALIANGPVTAIYVYNNAADTDELSLTSPTTNTNLFCNNNANSPCSTAAAFGDEKSLGTFSNASLVFSLQDLTPGELNTFFSNAPDSDGNYHVIVTTNFSSLGFNGGVLPSAVQADIAALAPGTTVTYVAWEDRTVGEGSDFDYNDLVFAFTNVASTPVPEPISVSLFGAGLAGAAWINKRRQSKKA
jgi:hypothetical protein